MRRGAARKAKLQAASPAEAEIGSFAHDGRGVAHVDGVAVFVEGALPGERVEFRYMTIRRDYAEGVTQRILNASPDRVEPRCASYSICGGCRVQHLAVDRQISLKQEQLFEQLRRIGKVEPETVLPALTGPAWGYRRKARLGVKYVAKKGKVLVGFREKGSSLLADIDTCAVLHPSVGERIRDLAGLIEGLSVRDRVPQIEVAIGEDSTVLVFRLLAEPSLEERDRLKAFGDRFGFLIRLQRHGPESIVPLAPNDSGTLSYQLPEFGLRYEFAACDFTQVNQDINRVMVHRAVELLQLESEHEVLDLFCGLGNFTLPIALRARHVIGLEGDPGLIAKARHNATLNQIGNAEFHAADLFAAHDGAPWIDRRFDRVLLDPSRAGAQEVLRYVPRWQAARIVYVSCNPATLARDAGILVHEYRYRLVAAGVMDMFPHTAHVESIAVFVR